MASKPVAPRPERVETDSSLQAEREQTDEQLLKRDSALEQKADDVVVVARQRADDVLEVAREKADATAGQAADAPVAKEVADARAAEDSTLSNERAEADGKLATERSEDQKVHTLLLALERGETDERLLKERVGSDSAVSSRDDFFAMVSHDVRGLLGLISMSAEVMVQVTAKGPEGDPTRHEAKRIVRLTGRMTRVVEDLLDVVSIESGKLKMVPTRQDAGPLLAEIVETFQVAAAARKIGMNAKGPRGPLPADFDSHRILQVLTNLVGNAMKFTQQGGTITLQVETTSDGLQFTVCDSGCGIAAEQIEVIFERFSQVHQAEHRGLGLGLYIARSIVEAHGGRIWAESKHGEGSAFHFTLPTSGPSPLPGGAPAR